MKKTVLAILTALAVMSCKSTKVSQEQLSMNNWELVSISGNAPAAGERVKPNIKFAENKITGNGGCNSFNGGYTLAEDGTFNAERVISTKMYCEGSKESEFFTALAKANKLVMKNDKLVFMYNNHEMLIFAPAKQ